MPAPAAPHTRQANRPRVRLDGNGLTSTARPPLVALVALLARLAPSRGYAGLAGAYLRPLHQVKTARHPQPTSAKQPVKPAHQDVDHARTPWVVMTRSMALTIGKIG